MFWGTPSKMESVIEVQSGAIHAANGAVLAFCRRTEVESIETGLSQSFLNKDKPFHRCRSASAYFVLSSRFFRSCGRDPSRRLDIQFLNMAGKGAYMGKTKQLSSPFSSGGGGFRFENQVQATFVTLMLTGGCSPCLPCWPVVKVKLQGRVDGYHTDDLIVFVEKIHEQEQRKLLVQIKHFIDVTRRSTVFGSVIQAAWRDFNDVSLFHRGRDAIALITGPLNRTYTHSVYWLLEHARHTVNAQEFFQHIQKANFISKECKEKLALIRHHLETANDNRAVDDEEVHAFLRHLHLLCYDLDSETGMIRSLFLSYISQFQPSYPEEVWSRISSFVQDWNQHAGTITKENIPEEIWKYFRQKPVAEMPATLLPAARSTNIGWSRHKHATCLARALLLGSWQDDNQDDQKVVSEFLGICYESWRDMGREFLSCSGSPLTLQNGIWNVVNRVELWKQLGERILDSDLDSFGKLALSVLEEPGAAVCGKPPIYSRVLRKGLSEGLAILGCHPEACTHASPGRAESTGTLVIHKLLSSADWGVWVSLEDLLPVLAEASPQQFLDTVRNVLCLTPCPFDELFPKCAQGILESNHLVGLLWALEVLAWDSENLFAVCDILGNLASCDPEGQSGNHPFDSLVAILLPWLPQTNATAAKRLNVVQCLLEDWPDIAWKLLLHLLPQGNQISAGTCRPQWRWAVAEDWKGSVTEAEYARQTLAYAELAVSAAGQKFARCFDLIDRMASLPGTVLDMFLQRLDSQVLQGISEEEKFSVWEHLVTFVRRHREFADASWALPCAVVDRIETTAQNFAPMEPFYNFQGLFKKIFHEQDEDLDQRQQALKRRQEEAVKTLFENNGISCVIRFADAVGVHSLVGECLGSVDNDTIDDILFPAWLDENDTNRLNFLHGFVLRRYACRGWAWCENLNVTSWTLEQKSQFLALLPFNKDIRKHIPEWLHENEDKYWDVVHPYFYRQDDHDDVVAKLILYRRPYAAIVYLYIMHVLKIPVNKSQCIEALLSARYSSEKNGNENRYEIIDIIKFLQKEGDVDIEKLCEIEWSYFDLLDGYTGNVPQTLEHKLAEDPDFFCHIIQLAYKSKKEEYIDIEITEDKEYIAKNAWKLLQRWKIVPGTRSDGHFDADEFKKWFMHVKNECIKSGHIEVALNIIGKVLIYSSDSDGLWIHRAVAEILNDKDNKIMRQGYEYGQINARGVHAVDPEGVQEKELAEKFRMRAEEMENASYFRIAEVMKRVAAHYDREAERCAAEYGKNLDS